MYSKLCLTYTYNSDYSNLARYKYKAPYLYKILHILNLCTLLLLNSLVAVPTYGALLQSRKDQVEENNVLLDSLRSQSLSEPSKALSQAFEALKKAEYTGDDYGYANAYYTVGLSYDMLGEDQLALKYFHLALDRYRTLNDTIKVGKTLNNIGVVYDELGDYNEALHYYIQALEHIKNANDPDSELTLYNNIGLIYATNGLKDKALNSLYKAYDLGIQYDLYESIPYPLHSLGETYMMYQQYDSALHYFLRSYRADEAANNRYSLAQDLLSMGQVYLETQEYEKAESHLMEALDIQIEIEDKYYQTQTMILLGKLYFSMRDYDTATKFAKNALSNAKASSSKSQMKDVTELLSDINRDLKNYKKAIYYTDLSNTYKDSIFNDFKSKQLLLLELNKKEVENAALLTDNEYKTAVMDDQQHLIEKQTYAVIFVSLGLILSFIAVSVLVNSNKDKNLANKKLIRQKEEIEKIIRELTILNENINQQKNELQQSNQVKDKLLSIISHDFRSPLNSLEGILDLISQDKISSQEMQSISKELKVKVNSTTSLLDNMLNWAKSQMHGIKTNPAYFDIQELIDDTLNLLSTQAERKDIRIFNKVNQAQEVFADYEMTKLVVRNLLSNAIKFTTSGDKIIVKSNLDNGYLWVLVKDTGKGMTPEEQKKLFTHEAKSTLGTAYEKGTGLGLLLCKDFVERNGGSISVESEEGEGSTFVFSIPLSDFEDQRQLSKDTLTLKR